MNTRRVFMVGQKIGFQPPLHMSGFIRETYARQSGRITAWTLREGIRYHLPAQYRASSSAAEPVAEANVQGLLIVGINIHSALSFQTSIRVILPFRTSKRSR